MGYRVNVLICIRTRGRARSGQRVGVMITRQPRRGSPLTGDPLKTVEAKEMDVRHKPNHNDHAQ